MIDLVGVGGEAVNEARRCGERLSPMMVTAARLGGHPKSVVICCKRKINGTMG